MIDSGDVLKLDQSQLETVIPNIGGKLKVVNGAYRGETATLSAIDTEHFCGQIKLETGPRMGNIVACEYEDICKIYSKEQ
jgi:DNA/RNA-binding protein KIN17